MRSNAQQTLQHGRFEALTPAERDQLEEEKRKWLLGWFKRREAAKEKAQTVTSISEPEKAVEKEALETVPEKQREADEGENEAKMNSDSAGETPCGITGDVSAHLNLSCKYPFIKHQPPSSLFIL